MTNSGRLQHAVRPIAARMLFERHRAEGSAVDSVREELEALATIDQAHLVMLSEQGLVSGDTVALLLREIGQLRAVGFEPILARPAPRGTYLAYESWLIERLGADVGGVIHTGRSRNDLSATALRLRLREPYARFLREAIRLGVVALRRAERHRAVVMPAYTHYQAAVPITYGHYLAGFGMALVRGVRSALDVGTDLDESPLGAGAVGGTSVPIDPRRTAELLGFGTSALNSLEAVASRDIALRLLAELSVMGVLLSRLAQDLLLWTTEEFGFLHLPDDLVGSSSMMPQKRNAFLLEHVQGKSAAALGAFTAAASAMRSAPFTNSIAVGTEGIAHLWGALEATTDAFVLARLVIADARPDVDAMGRRAVLGYTTATALAERLVAAGMPFRRAHHRVGAAIGEAVAGGRPLVDAEPGMQIDPADVVTACEYGGGPGPRALESCLLELRHQWRCQARRLPEICESWRQGGLRLESAVGQLTGQRVNGSKPRHA